MCIRDSKDTDSSVAANQPIGEISWYSTDAGMTNVNSWIRGINEATNGSGALLFGVKAAGSSEIEALRITSAGNIGIGTINPVRPLHILAADCRIRLEDAGVATDVELQNTSGDAVLTTNGASNVRLQTDNTERLRINSDGRVLVGTTAARTVGGAVHRLLQVEGTDGRSGISITRNSNNASTPTLDFGKSRGNSVGSNVIVQEDDQLGVIQFCGSDGTDIETEAAQIEGQVDGTPGSNDMPGRLVFKTTPDGSSTAVERLRIASNGKILIGSNTVRNIGGASALGHFQIEGTTGNTSSVSLINNQNNSSGIAVLRFAKTRGTSDGAVTTVADGDSLGAITFTGADGTDLLNSTAQIRAIVNGTVAGNTIPTDILFETSATNGSSTSEKLRITSDGKVGINVTDPDAKLEVRDSAATGFIVRCTNTQSTNSNKALRVRNNSDTNTFHVSHKGQGYFADSIGISTSEPVSKLEVRGDINFQNFALISNFDSNGVGGTNIDHIWHSDAPNYGRGGTWNFVSDAAYKATGNSAIQIGYLANSGGGHLIGDVGIGLTTISRGPLHVHENSSDDCEIHLTNNDTGTTSSDGLTIFTDTDTAGVWSREDVAFDIATAGTRSLRLHSTGGLSVNTTSKSTNSMFQVDNHGDRDTGTTSNESQYVCFVDSHFTGSGGTITANRAKAAMRLDTEFSCSTPSTTATGNRFSVYGIYADIQATKYAYVNDGAYFFVKSTADNQPSSTGSTTLRGVYGYAQGYLTSSPQNVNIYGGYFLGYRGGSVTNGHAYGVYARAHNTNASGNTGDLTGVYAEIEQDDSTTITNAYAFRGYCDRDGGTITNGYILYGSYGGDSSFTNRWGIYINDSAKNRLGGDLEITGTFEKGTDNFRIPHPLVGLTTTKDLVHSVIEGPQMDLIYRGKTDLVAGISTINIDTKAGMTEGTFVALCRDIQCFTSNETGWTNVKGSVTGNKITIIAQDNSCTDTISWMVVGERQDDNAKSAKCTDNDGNLIVEPDKRTDLNDKYQAECEKNVYNED